MLYPTYQESLDAKYEQAEKEFNRKEVRDKVEYTLSNFEDTAYDIIMAELQENFPQREFTYEDINDMNDEECWQIIEHTYNDAGTGLYNKIIAKYFQESL